VVTSNGEPVERVGADILARRLAVAVYVELAPLCVEDSGVDVPCALRIEINGFIKRSPSKSSPLETPQSKLANPVELSRGLNRVC